MFSDEKRALKRSTDKLKKALGDKLISVTAFGSRVRGDFTGESDFDVLVIVREKTFPIIEKVIDIFQDVELKTNIPFSPIVKSIYAFEKEKKYKTGFFKNIETEGVIFYGKIKHRGKNSSFRL